MSPVIDLSGDTPAQIGAFAERAEPTASERERSRPAFADVMRAQAPFVLRLALRLGVSRDEVDDVAQEVFLVLHRRYEEWSLEVPIRSLLFGIVRRRVANQRRKTQARRESDPEGMPELAHPGPDPLRALEQGNARVMLDQALATLDADKREVFVLFELEGIAMQDVATMVGCSLKTAYSRLYAGRDLVKRSVLRASTTGKIR